MEASAKRPESTVSDTGLKPWNTTIIPRFGKAYSNRDLQLSLFKDNSEIKSVD
jgi:hypothetical protein